MLKRYSENCFEVQKDNRKSTCVFLNTIALPSCYCATSSRQGQKCDSFLRYIHYSYTYEYLLHGPFHLLSDNLIYESPQVRNKDNKNSETIHVQIQEFSKGCPVDYIFFAKDSPERWIFAFSPNPPFFSPLKWGTRMQTNKQNISRSFVFPDPETYIICFAPR